LSLLTICQSLTLRVLKSKPIVAVTSADPAVLQAVELINEAGQELCARHSWQVMTREATFNTVATEVQGTIQNIAGIDFNFIVNETMWNRTQRRPLFGPKSAAEWQNLKAQFSSGPWVSYRLRSNQMLFFPTPAAGQSVYFEWCSKYWATSKDGAPQAGLLQDSDVAILDERLLTLDAIWRFKRANQLSYDEDYEKAEDAIADAISRDGSKPRLNLAGPPNELQPVVTVPIGNWTL